METDREVLIWLYNRMVHRHKEEELLDYMHRFRWIIRSIPPTKCSCGQDAPRCANSLKDLGPILKKKSKFEKEMINWEPKDN